MAQSYRIDERREQLNAILVEIVGPDGKVYFQPPSNAVLKYPCIVYNREATETKFADNIPYLHTRRYNLTVMDLDPNSEIPDKVRALPMTRHETWFAVDNLNHDVFNIYF